MLAYYNKQRTYRSPADRGLEPPATAASGVANKVLRNLNIFKGKVLDDLTQWTAPQSRQHAERAKARKHWEKSFVRWCMCANMDNQLADIVPLGCIVPQHDLDYYCRKEKIQPLRPWSPLDRYNAALEALHQAILVVTTTTLAPSRRPAVPLPASATTTTTATATATPPGTVSATVSARTVPTTAAPTNGMRDGATPLQETKGEAERLQQPASELEATTDGSAPEDTRHQQQERRKQLLLQACLNQHAALAPQQQQHRGVTVRRIKGIYSFDSRFKITTRQYNRLRQLYRGKAGYFHDAAHDLLERYHFFGGLNGHLAMPPHLYPGSAIELFGTPLNTSHPFCSPFAAEAVLWSSMGSFFNYELKAGFYTANPIFDDAVMERMAERLLQQLKAAQDRKEKIDVLITLPIWDPLTQIELGLENSLTDFVALDRLRSSAFFKQSQTLLKLSCPYFDYFSEQHVPVSNTHLILLSNYDPSAINVKLIAEAWGKVRSGAPSTA
jgi:hypothetical protein